MTTIVFSHGKESGPWGTKIRVMAAAVRKLGFAAESIDYRGIAEPSERVDELLAACRRLDGPLVLVGSSMGGHVATAAAQEIDIVGLFVIAPAFFMPGYEELTPPPPDVPICIVHGWHDDIVPVDNSIRFARQCRATLHLVDGDHRLAANVDEINHYLRQYLEHIGVEPIPGEQKCDI